MLLGAPHVLHLYGFFGFFELLLETESFIDSVPFASYLTHLLPSAFVDEFELHLCSLSQLLGDW